MTITRTFMRSYLVILRLSRKLGEPCLRGIDGDRDLELLRLVELDDEEDCDLERDLDRLGDLEREPDWLRERLLPDEELRLRRIEL